MPEKTVLVLGGSLAGLQITHRLLKHTLPHEPDLKVILVSRNSHFYWNTASVRAVIPGLIKDEELLQPIEPGLGQYPAGSVEFIVGAATQVDKHAKTVEVETASSGSRTLRYDYLVLATGARAADTSMPWKASGTYEDCVEALHRTAERIGRASHIVVAGAGATGVELAAEIRFEYKDKTVVLLSADEELVGGDSTASALEWELVHLGVEIKKGLRSEGVEELDDGKTQVSLSTGDKIVTDLFLPTMGLVPNTEFLPAEYLDDKKFADVDAEFRVKAAVEDTWALGDVVSKPRPSIPETDAQAAGVAKNIDLALKGQTQVPIKGYPVDVFLCTTGRHRGAGRLGWFRTPSIAVWAIKGRTLGTERTAKTVNGTSL
ncbi:Apoptosis-inducing factor-like protein [Hapsidospora chrysogenum ATCC 11550]|uniref:Apoptosis-inducing factor-like protein n=1 Tax=Hapsidospora chrysogenum (strain ATCC 11550 / CBS 779.69 / DSM 880 / IAM 14645 / JCM 23072 / IMI 49137) TaxID=857340 RepID=A0A086STN4_HAPC1|nr:Apoptosis-inducing factor-like protein [Hapsidospora chrysogenum ATCC 11550]